MVASTSILPKGRFLLYIFLLKMAVSSAFLDFGLPQIENKSERHGYWVESLRTSFEIVIITAYSFQDNTISREVGTQYPSRYKANYGF